MTIMECWKYYEQDKTILGYSKNTLKAYKIQVRLIAGALGNPDISTVTYEQLKEYLFKQSHLKPASMGHRVRFIRSLFRWAVDEGHSDKNPAARLKEPRIGERVPKFLSEEAVETLREGCKTPLEHAIIEFMYTSGCRIGEIVQVNINDIDWNNNSLVVHGKGDKEREIYFNIKCRIWLKKYLEVRDDEELALFVNERAPHRRTSISQLRYVVKRVAARAGVEANVYPHRLRHSYATHLLENGAPMEAIQTLMGHSKPETTALYAKLSGERRRQIYKRYF